MSEDTYAFTHETMGTVWNIQIVDILKEDFNKISKEIISYLDEFNIQYSRFRKDSLVTELSLRSGQMTVPHECVEMLSLYSRMSELTHGLFNPFIGHTLSDLGYDSEYSLKEKTSVRPTPNFSDAIEILDDKTICIREPVLVDFGAIGKGFAVDAVSAMILDKGYASIVDGSGDMKNTSDTELKIGLEDPEDMTKVIGSLKIHTGSIASSSGNRRFWKGRDGERRHHIIHPQTYESPKFIRASWVKHASCAVADALATALFLVPPDMFSESYDFEYILINKDRKVKKSFGLDMQLFS